MNNKKQWSSLLLGLFLAVNMSLAQTPVKLPYAQYMSRVIDDNLGYAAEKCACRTGRGDGGEGFQRSEPFGVLL